MTLRDEYAEALRMGKGADMPYMVKLCRQYAEPVTKGLKERFCKDWNIPIRLYSEPYFSERLALYDQYKACVLKFADFLVLVERLGGEQPYFAEYHRVKDAAIKYLNENEAMLYLRDKEDMSKFPGLKDFPSNDIFKQTFIGKQFVSIDLVKGNFTALKHYNPATVGGCETYDDFMKMFTDEAYIRESKYIRQVIFGKVTPKRQVTYETYMMSLVLKDLLEFVPRETVVYVSTDELVLDVDTYTAAMFSQMTDVVYKHRKDGINTSIEHFQLGFISETGTYYKLDLASDMTSAVLEFKCMTHSFMPFVIKALCRYPVLKNDSVFEIEGKLAVWVEPTKISFKGLPKLKRSWEK